jgi:hypothetical protein
MHIEIKDALGYSDAEFLSIELAARIEGQTVEEFIREATALSAEGSRDQ